MTGAMRDPQHTVITGNNGQAFCWYGVGGLLPARREPSQVTAMVWRLCCEQCALHLKKTMATWKAQGVHVQALQHAPTTTAPNRERNQHD